MSARHAERKASALSKLSLVFVRLDHVASVIVNANHGIVVGSGIGVGVAVGVTVAVGVGDGGGGVGVARPCQPDGGIWLGLGLSSRSCRANDLDCRRPSR